MSTAFAYLGYDAAHYGPVVDLNTDGGQSKSDIPNKVMNFNEVFGLDYEECNMTTGFNSVRLRPSRGIQFRVSCEAEWF